MTLYTERKFVSSSAATQLRTPVYRGAYLVGNLEISSHFSHQSQLILIFIRVLELLEISSGETFIP